MTGVAAEQAPKNVFGGSDDLNDVFNSITCFESNIVHEGYREGLNDGRQETATRGFVIGFNTGSSVCLDLGYAISFCTVILQSSECSDRPCNPYLRKSCEEVISKVKAYPTTNLENEDLVAKAEEIKIKLEKIKNILKMNSDQGENETINYTHLGTCVCLTVSEMAKLEEVQTALKSLSNFLQPALPFINSHLNSFFTDDYWEEHLPKNLQEDLSAVTVSELKNYFNQLACIKRKSSGKPLNTPVRSNVSFTESNLEDIINRIGQLFLCSLNLSCGVDQFDLTSSAVSDLGENDDSLSLNATELCETTSNTSYVGWSSCKFDPFMSPKKMHEVEIMSEFVLKVANFQNDSSVVVSSSKSCDDLPSNSHPSSRLCQPFGVEYLIDLGSGKGYLSSFLVLLYNYKVLAIDSSSVNTYGCTKRTATLQKNWSSFIRRAQERQTQSCGTTKRGKHWKSRNVDTIMHNLHVSDPVATTPHESNTGAKIGNAVLPDNTLNSVSVPSSEVESETSENLKSVTLYVMDNLNLLHLLRENFCICSVSSESSISYGLVGLHTCGTLGVDSIKLFCNSEQAKFLVNVPCCYHLLNEQYEDVDSAVAGDTNKAFGFPLCKNLQRIQFCVGRNARMMSAQSVHRMSSDDGNLEISRPLLFRALLSVIIKQKLGHTALKTHVGRIGGKFSNFQQYVRKALAKLQLKDLKVSEDEIDEVYRSYEQSIERFHKYFLLRALFAPLIETCILLDRLAYLLEQENVRETYIVELFDPFLSPRCHAVVALR